MDPPPEFAPELGILDLAGDVEPPPIGPKPDPVLRHAEDVLAHDRVVGIELRQRRQVPPGAVAEGLERLEPRRVGLAPLGLQGVAQRLVGVRPQLAPRVERVGVEVEPVAVRAVATGLHHVVERPEAARGVVEDAVQDDPHPAAVRRVEELAERVVAAQERVDGHVVERVIPMVRSRAENRIQVDRIDPELGEVVEVLRHTAQVAAFEAVPGR